jgi:octaprenyl-diphosphate synthase
MSSLRSRVAELLAPIEVDMQRMRAVIAGELESDSPAVRDMTSHVGRFQGKQLRAALVLMVAAATGRRSDERASVAAIVEMIHLATLVHDDVLDGAEVRRRVACVNERWDNQTAILLGDFLYSRAFGLSTRLSSRLPSQLLAGTTSRLCAGEISQASLRYTFDMPQGTYEEVAAAKTGALYAAACELGARYAPERSFGTDDIVGQEMRHFGEELGLAFQIIDDCLDVTGDPETVGKSVGTDVEDGKVTLPVLFTYANSDSSQQARIRDIYTAPAEELGVPSEGGGRARLLREEIDLEAGLKYAHARAEALVEIAVGRLAILPTSQARQTLESVGAFVLGRNW